MSDAASASRPKYERRKAVIVRAAVDVINRKGVSSMTLAEVASRLELVPTAVNYYFRRKEDLAAACFHQAIARHEQLMRRSDREPTPEASLRAFLHDFADDLVAAARGEVDPIVTFNDVRTIGDEGVDRAYVDMFRHIRRIFSPGTVGGPVQLQRNARTHLLISQVFWARLWLRQYDPADYRRMADRLYDILVNGLAAPGRAFAPRELPPIPAPGGVHEAFLRAATDLINEQGYLGASLSRISARLNVTKGSFYHHIPAKADLVEQCFARTLDIMRRSQLAADAVRGTGLDNLASLAATMVRRDLSGEGVLLRTSALTAVPEEMSAQMVERFNQVSARLASVISDGIADGSVRPVDANVAAQTLTALINASAELHHWAPGIDAATAADTYVRPLFVGIFKPHGPAPPAAAAVEVAGSSLA